jgi:hypothetical protein
MNIALQPAEFEAISDLKDFSCTPPAFMSYLPRSGSTYSLNSDSDKNQLHLQFSIHGWPHS